MLDIHCHLLPGVDDGSPDINTSLELCRQAANEGVRGIIATPHYWQGVYQPDWAQVMRATDRLNQQLAQNQIAVTVYPGMEVHLDMNLPLWLAQGKVGTLNNTGRYLLVELPGQEVPPYTAMVLAKLQASGITPILAHPERNRAVMASPQVLQPFVANGVGLQITGASLVGAFGRRVAHTARQLLQYRWVDFIASDAHDLEKRPYLLQPSLAVAAEILGQEAALQLVEEFPWQVIQGEALPSRIETETWAQLAIAQEEKGSKKRGLMQKLFSKIFRGLNKNYDQN